MPGTGNAQHRGASVPAGPGLLQRIINLETALGIQGANASAYFTVNDANRVARARIGYLPTGDYGIQVQDQLGNHQEVQPVVSGYHDGALTTTSGTFVSLSDFGTLAVNLGASGDALITICAYISVTTGGTAGRIGLSINGAAPAANFTSGTSASLNASQSSTKRLRAYLSANTLAYLTPGVNDFALMYISSTGGDTVSFQQISLIIQPL